MQLTSGHITLLFMYVYMFFPNMTEFSITVFVFHFICYKYFFSLIKSFHLFSCTGSQLRHMGSSSLTRDRTWVPCIGSKESQPVDHQGRPCEYFSILINILPNIFYWLKSFPFCSCATVNLIHLLLLGVQNVFNTFNITIWKLL